MDLPRKQNAGGVPSDETGSAPAPPPPWFERPRWATGRGAAAAATWTFHGTTTRAVPFGRDGRDAVAGRRSLGACSAADDCAAGRANVTVGAVSEPYVGEACAGLLEEVAVPPGPAVRTARAENSVVLGFLVLQGDAVRKPTPQRRFLRAFGRRAPAGPRDARAPSPALRAPSGARGQRGGGRRRDPDLGQGRLPARRARRAGASRTPSEPRRRRGRDADGPLMNRGDAAAAARIFRGGATTTRETGDGVRLG